MDFGGSFTTLFHLEILVSTLKLWMLIAWIFAIFFKFILVRLFSLISGSQPFINVQKHLFSILPSLPPPGCCLKTFIYCITFLTTTWLLFKDIYLLYYLPYHYMVAV